MLFPPTRFFLTSIGPVLGKGILDGPSRWKEGDTKPVMALIWKEPSGSLWRRPEMDASWRTTFLAVSILSRSCFLQAQFQDSPISITLIPPDAIQGQNITLRPDQSTAKVVLCRWYRGSNTDQQIITHHTLSVEPLRGLAFTGRETINTDCSLHIRNLSPSDSGNYTLEFLGPGVTQGTASFTVLESKGSQTEQSYWVILGPVLALTLLGVLLGISFWIHHLRIKKSTTVQPAAPLYYNISTSGQNGRSSSNQTNPYEDLQFGNQDTYEQLKK